MALVVRLSINPVNRRYGSFKKNVPSASAQGGRSRTGRIQLDSIAHGMGRIVNSIPECHALCVYLRGDRQDTWSTLPKRGDSFYVDFEMFRPESETSGLRRSRHFAMQIGDRLVQLEEKYFAREGAAA